LADESPVVESENAVDRSFAWRQTEYFAGAFRAMLIE
jgi:hypothetical protein